MTAEEDALLRTLEARVTQVTLEYKALKDRYAALSRTMEEKDATIAALHSQIDRLQTDYANLKTAKMIDISSEDMKNAKSRLSKLVREVDKCIALLNEYNIMEVSEDFTITLRLGQQPLSITIRREDEEAYRAAEKLINQKYNSYAAQYPDQGNEIYLCMAALSIALSLKKNEFRNDTQPFVDSMKRMLDTLDETLGTKAQ